MSPSPTSAMDLQRDVMINNSSPPIGKNPSSGARNKCAFNGCGNTKAKFPALHFFKFPVTRKAICDTWIANCANDAIAVPPSTSLRHKVVCENHFTRESFTSDLKNRIKAFAVPRSQSQIEEFYRSLAAKKKEIKANLRLKGGISDCMSDGNNAQLKKHICLVSPSLIAIDSSNPSSGTRNKCSFVGCSHTKAKFPALHFFKFPVSRKGVCDTWLLNCANNGLVSLPGETLRHRVVCEKHFTRECFTNDMKVRLTDFAVPTLATQYDQCQALIESETLRQEDCESGGTLAGNMVQEMNYHSFLFPSHKNYTSVKGNKQLSRSVKH